MRHFSTAQVIVATTLLLLLAQGCGALSPASSGPTNPPPVPSEAAAASTVARPGASAKPSAKPGQAGSPVLASPVPSAVGSPAAAAAPAVNAPVLLSGPLTSGFVLQSSAFMDSGTLPNDYSCDAPGGGKSPPLNWTGAPTSTRAFALVDQDPDAGASGNAFTHWMVFNIPANITQLEAGLPAGDVLPNGALQGQNGRRVVAYQGACPPAGSPPHHYTIQLWALSGPLALPIGATIVDLQRAMSGYVVGQTQLVALFAR